MPKKIAFFCAVGLAILMAYLMIARPWRLTLDPEITEGWSQYRQRLTMPIRIHGIRHGVVPFEVFLDGERILIKDNEGVNVVEGLDGDDCFTYVREDGLLTVWTGKGSALSDPGLFRDRLRRSADNELVPALTVMGESLDQLIASDQVRIVSVQEKTKGDQDFVEVSCIDRRDWNKSFTVLLDPQRYWTIESYIYLNEGSETTKRFEFVDFQGVPVVRMERWINKILLDDQDPPTLASTVMRNYEEITSDEFQQAFKQSKLLGASKK